LSRYDSRPPGAWAFEEAPGGKPVLAAHDASALSFNLSHTHGFVACAVTLGTEVGIDVENVDRNLRVQEIAERYFAPDELSDLAACPPDARAKRFFDFWTLKEAYLKAIGVGLSHPPNAIWDERWSTFRGAARPGLGLRSYAPPHIADRRFPHPMAQKK
jgi:4'-phosphopantetheinyl transferase